MATRFIDPIPQWVNDRGLPLAGGSIEFFITGTTTHASTFSDFLATVANPNPLVLNASGRASSDGVNEVDVYLSAAVSYRAVLRDVNGVTIRTIDPFGDTENIVASWNAATNIPPIPAASEFNLGAAYRVSTAGTTNINGIADWEIGDTLVCVFDGLSSYSWVKVAGTVPIIRVAGLQGDISADELIAALPAFAGDPPAVGLGGTKGLVPAPADGDGVLGKVLGADGTWRFPAVDGSVSNVILHTFTTASLRSVPTAVSPMTAGQTYVVKINDSGREAIYEWVPVSTLPHDGRYCIQPTDRPATAGRWLRVGSKKRIHVGLGQSNEFRTSPVAVTTPTGTWPGDLIPVAGTYDRVTGSPNDTITFRGPLSISPAVTAYEPNTGLETTVDLASVFSSGKNAVSLGTAVRIHNETDDPVMIIKRAISSTPLERWLLSSVIDITNVTVAGSEVTLHVSDMRLIQTESGSPSGQYVDLVAPAGMAALSGRFRVQRLTPVWNTTRDSKVAYPGTLKLYTNADALYDGSSLPPYSSGGKVQLHHLWNDFIDDITAVETLYPNASVSIGMAQSEANGGAAPTDLYTTTGGGTRNFARKRAEFIRQIRTRSYLVDAVIAFAEAARDGVNFPDKPTNINTAESAGLDPRSLVYSSAGFVPDDDTHNADQYSIGELVRGPAILGLERSGKYDVTDPAYLRWAQQPDGLLGHRWGYPITATQEVIRFSEGFMRGRSYWNSTQINAQASRIELNTDDMQPASRYAAGGQFCVFVTSLTGPTPNGTLPVPGTDAVAAGRTSIVATGWTFVDAASKEEFTNVYYCGELEVEYRFKIQENNFIAVFKETPSIVSGSWTPEFTFDTQGNLSVTGTSTGSYWTVSGVTYMAFDMVITPTFTTSSGILRISGFPVAAVGTNVFMCNLSHSSNLAYGAGKSMVQLVLNGTQAFIQAQGSGSGATALTTTAVTSGTSITLRGCIAVPGSP